MSSQPIDAASTSPSTKASLLTALHDAMETNVKVNQSTLSGGSTSQPSDTTEATAKKTPPTAPPSISFDQYQSRSRFSRSQSFSTKSNRTGPDYLQVPGQFNGQLVPFDPRAEFTRLSDGATDSLPRSSLQLPESSTILHPSGFKQIVPFNTKFASGMDSKGRPRRHTISGALTTQRVPSAYREVLVQKAMKDQRELQQQRDLEARAGKVPGAAAGGASAGAPSDASSEPSKIVESHLNPFLAGESAPKPSPPRPRRKPKTEGKDEESSESEEEKEENDEKPAPEMSPAPSPSDDQLQVFGLQYDGGLIDFVDHPPTNNPPVASAIPPVTTPEETTPTEKSEDMLDMERAMSPHPSS